MENTHKVCFINKSPNPDPDYAKPGDSGMDLRAWIMVEEGHPENTNVPLDNPGCRPFVTIDTENGAYRYGIKLKPLERVLIHTGIYFSMDKFCEIQVRPKSGRALKEGITVLNTPGTVDNQYQGECCVIVANLSNKDVEIMDGEKIAQAVVCPVYYNELVTLNKVDEFDNETERGSGGFGHTGI